MQVMRLHYFCDNKPAGHPPMEVEGDTILVFSDKQQQVVHLDICDDCLSTLTFIDMATLANKWGREIPEPEVDVDLTCPLGCNDGEPFKNKGGKGRHMTVKHPEWRG